MLIILQYLSTIDIWAYWYYIEENSFQKLIILVIVNVSHGLNTVKVTVYSSTIEKLWEGFWLVEILLAPLLGSPKFQEKEYGLCKIVSNTNTLSNWVHPWNFK